MTNSYEIGENNGDENNISNIIFDKDKTTSKYRRIDLTKEEENKLYYRKYNEGKKRSDLNFKKYVLNHIKNKKIIILPNVLKSTIDELRNKGFNPQEIKNIFKIYDIHSIEKRISIKKSAHNELERILNHKIKFTLINHIKINKSHPNLNHNYFETINTKEKAYWLGFLYADGYITGDSRHLNLRVEMKLKRNELKWIEKFANTIGANHEKIEDNVNTYRIRISSSKMAIDLINHGCVFNKSNIIEFPDSIALKKLKSAFLLGFYDGDGQQNTSKITSGSKLFLNQIRNEFKINNKLIFRSNFGEIEGRRIISQYYVLILGNSLKREMMKNFSDSLPRKRI